MKHIPKGGNPYLDSLEAKEQFNSTLLLLESKFGTPIRVARSQTFLFENKANPIQIKIISAPSSLKLVADIKNTIKALRSKTPFYVLFTRDVKSYPASKKSYYDKIKALYSLRKPFNGVIMGINELKSQNVIDTLKDGQMLPLNLNRYKDAGGELSLEKILMEQFKISARSAKMKAEAIEVLIKK
jgi:hypothetical protein